MTSRFTLILFAAALLAVFLAGCTQTAPDIAPTAAPTLHPSPLPSTLAATPVPFSTSVPAARSQLKGVGLSPKSFSPDDFAAFWVQASQAGQVVSWEGDWAQLGDAKEAPAVAAQLAKQKGLKFLVNPQLFSQQSGELLRPLDAENEANYVTWAAAFASDFKPDYFGVGIEVNVLAEKNLSAFEEYVSLYGRVRDAVKTASPNTLVFPVFQLERLRGLRGGLFGGTNNESDNDWALLDRFPNADAAAFTTYPGLVYKNPADIPADYYSAIALHTSKPIIFTETGWFRSPAIAGWESSEAEQAEFVRTLFERTRNLNNLLLVWSFLYDPAVGEPFKTMGMRAADGSASPAWDAWPNAS